MKTHFTYLIVLITTCFLLSCSSSSNEIPPTPEKTKLIVSPLQLTFESQSSGSKIVNVETNVDTWEFKLGSGVEWINVTPNIEGGYLTISVQDNTSEKSRTAVLTITANKVSSEVAIIQKSTQGEITELFLYLHPKELTFAYDGLEEQKVDVLTIDGAELAVEPLDGWDAVIAEDNKSMTVRPTGINIMGEDVSATLTVKASMSSKEVLATIALTQKASENSSGFIVAPKTLYFDYTTTQSKQIVLAFNSGTTWTWKLVPIKNDNDGEWVIKRLNDNTLQVAPGAVNDMFKPLRGEVHFTADVPGKGTVTEIVKIIQSGFPPILGEVTGYYRAYGNPSLVNPSEEVTWTFYFEKAKGEGGLDIILSNFFGHEDEKSQPAGSRIAIDFPRSGTPVIYPYVTGTTTEGYNLVPMGAELNRTTKTIKLIERCEGMWDSDALAFDFTRSDSHTDVVVGVFIIDPATGEYKGQLTELYSALRLNLLFILPSYNSTITTVGSTIERAKISTKPAKLIEGVTNIR